MAQCQENGHLAKQHYIACCVCLLMFVLTMVAHHAHANDVNRQHLAMGDIGAIKTDDQLDKAAQLKWAELTKAQQTVLAPLAKEWDTLLPWQRDKMLDIARDYPKMDAKKQARVSKRLHAWSRMTPYERENARERYQKFHNLSPEEKAELRKKWAEHQKLPEAEREKRRKDSNDSLYDPSFD